MIRFRSWLVPFLTLGAAACTGEDVLLGEGRTPGAADTATVLVPEASSLRAIEPLSGDATEDDDPSLTSDMKEIYFNSQRDGGSGAEDIWSSTRGGTEDAWASPTPVEVLNTEQRETGVALAPNGLTLWFSSDRSASVGGLDVFVATRAQRGDAWSAPRRVDELSSADDDLVSAVTQSERILLLARRSDSDDDYDLFLADRDAPGGAWHAPLPLVELNTSDGESDGYLAADDATLFFTRAEDLFVANLESPETTAAPLVTLNSSEDDRDPWISPALDHIVFSSNRAGSYMLYEAHLAPPDASYLRSRAR